MVIMWNSRQPVFVERNHVMDPTISGSAAHGGKLLRNGLPLQLHVSFNCQYRGMGFVTIEVPIVPHGTIVFTLPKKCDGQPRPRSVFIPDLNVREGISNGDVIRDGVTQSAYLVYRPGAREIHHRIVSESIDSSSFVVDPRQKWWEHKVKALEPIVYAHHPYICDPVVDHSLPRLLDVETAPGVSDESTISSIPDANSLSAASSSDVLVSVSGTEEIDDEALEFIIGRQAAMLRVTYNCMGCAGETPITLTIPLLPTGKISFTWTKRCAAEELEMGLADMFSSMQQDCDVTPQDAERHNLPVSEFV